jgi:hypothetical protein
VKRFLSVAPGALWIAVILGLNGGAAWLSQYYGGLEWVPPVAGLLTLVLVPVIKVLAVPDAPAQAARGIEDEATPERSKFKRWLY